MPTPARRSSSRFDRLGHGWLHGSGVQGTPTRQTAKRTTLGAFGGTHARAGRPMIGLVLTGLVVFGLIGIGVGALVAPRAASRQYGILLDDARSLAFIRAMGVRDLVIGVFVLLLASTGRRDLLALGMAASAAVALLDFAVVSGDRAPGATPAQAATRSPARLLHGGGAIALLVAALVIATGR